MVETTPTPGAQISSGPLRGPGTAEVDLTDLTTPSGDTPPLPLAEPGTMGPPPAYERLRQHCPVSAVRTPMGARAWFVTRHEDVRALLADPRLIRPTINSWPPPPAGQAPSGPALVTMMEMEGPGHLALRRAVAEAFSASAVREWEPRIRAVADGLLDALEAASRPADLIAGYAEPFPLAVVCDLVGLPYADRGYFLPLADTALGALVTLEQGRAATEQLVRYVREVIDNKRRRPGNDVLSELVARQRAGDLAEPDLVSFGLSMLVAGYRTSTMFIANAVLTFLTQPEARAALAAAGHRLAPAAVAELLRFLPVMNGTVVLVATEELEVRGQRIAAGEAVLPVIASANRDPEVFPEPARLDLTRAPNPHLAFGRGSHNCAGIHLARAELRIALERLFGRFPRLRLAIPAEELPWDDDSPSKSPDLLPVHW